MASMYRVWWMQQVDGVGEHSRLCFYKRRYMPSQFFSWPCNPDFFCRFLFPCNFVWENLKTENMKKKTCPANWPSLFLCVIYITHKCQFSWPMIYVVWVNFWDLTKYREKLGEWKAVRKVSASPPSLSERGKLCNWLKQFMSWLFLWVVVRFEAKYMKCMGAFRKT